MATASIGALAEGAKTGAAVKTIKLLAQSTGDFTRDELKKDVKLSWTDKTKAEIAAAKGENGGSGSNSSTYKACDAHTVRTAARLFSHHVALEGRHAHHHRIVVHLL